MNGSNDITDRQVSTNRGGMTRLNELLPTLRSRRPRPQEIVDMGCPWSGGSLVLRQGPHGDFLGCIDYPECTYTERVLG